MAFGVEILLAHRSRLADLRSLFLTLHDHHRRVSAVPVTEPDDRAWRERAATYAGHFEDGRAVLHVATHRDRPVGYAFTILHDGTDDTFPLSPRYAELYTLAVLPEMRGQVSEPPSCGGSTITCGRSGSPR